MLGGAGGSLGPVGRKHRHPSEGSRPLRQLSFTYTFAPIQSICCPHYLFLDSKLSTVLLYLMIDMASTTALSMCRGAPPTPASGPHQRPVFLSNSQGSSLCISHFRAAYLIAALCTL